jgi:diamine N-acetyltransferase
MPNVRRARPADAPPLAALAERVFRDTFAAANDPADVELHCAKFFGADVQLREISDPNVVTLVCEQDGELVAYAQLDLNARIECVKAERPSEIVRFYVAAPWQGKGIAQELMTEVLATAKASGCDRVWLGVWERNDRGIRFYRKCGFKLAGEHAFVLGRDVQRDLVMARNID